MTLSPDIILSDAENQRRAALFKNSAEADLSNRMMNALERSFGVKSPKNPINPNAERLNNSTFEGRLAMKLAMSDCDL